MVPDSCCASHCDKTLASFRVAAEAEKGARTPMFGNLPGYSTEKKALGSCCQKPSAKTRFVIQKEQLGEKDLSPIINYFLREKSNLFRSVVSSFCNRWGCIVSRWGWFGGGGEKNICIRWLNIPVEQKECWGSTPFSHDLGPPNSGCMLPLQKSSLNQIFFLCSKSKYPFSKEKLSQHKLKWCACCLKNS